MSDGTEASYWIRTPGGEPQGPYPVSRIQEYVRAGRVRQEMEFSEDGASWWSGHDWPDMFVDAPAAAPAAQPVRAGSATRRSSRGGGGAPVSRRRRSAGHPDDPDRPRRYERKPRPSPAKMWATLGISALVIGGAIFWMARTSSRITNALDEILDIKRANIAKLEAVTDKASAVRALEDVVAGNMEMMAKVVQLAEDEKETKVRQSTLDAFQRDLKALQQQEDVLVAQIESRYGLD